MNRPQAGETWWVDFGYDTKPRYALVLASAADARLAIASVVLITKHFGGTSYEVSLPRVPWLPEQSYINAQSVEAVEFALFQRKAPGQFDAAVIESVRHVVKLWLRF